MLPSTMHPIGMAEKHTAYACVSTGGIWLNLFCKKGAVAKLREGAMAQLVAAKGASRGALRPVRKATMPLVIVVIAPFEPSFNVTQLSESQATLTLTAKCTSPLGL